MKYKKSTIVLSAIIVSITAIISCQKIMPNSPDAQNALDAPIDGLSNEQNRLFVEGANEFDEVYTTNTGLGPIYVASSCASCHSGDNKGHLFTTLTRFGQTDTFGNTFLHKGAPQVQNNFIVGHVGETVPSGASASNFVAPIVSGLGFLELLSDQDILNMADPNDANGDGISGRVNWNTIPNWVTPANNAITNNGKYICKFGKKASTYNLHQQTVQAFNQDIGITTTFLPQNPFNYVTGLQSSSTSDPDITDQSVNATVFYLKTLQTPFQRNANDATVLKGATLFKQLSCNSCHKEKLQTGFSNISVLSNQEFYPYTDLLLHDMGSNLDDNYTEGTALTNEWRTAPLWGLGLSTQSQGGNYFLMHDGRAKSIEQAIEMHEGEALQSKNKFKALSSLDKETLLTFLKSL
jgi:CxxC motif-containing protein (DUF1111 family)